MELTELSSTIERLPPQNLEAEMAVLGSMLLEEDALVRATELVEEAAFYKEAHRKIFAAMVSLYKEHVAVDLVTLTDELKKRTLLDEVGGPSYVAALTSVVPTAANVEHYCRIVKERAILRSLIKAATQIATGIFWTTAAYSAIPKARLLLPMAGRPATTMKSEGCSPASI